MLARFRKAAEEREGGFTLIELLVVIIIIGILAAIAIPVFLNQRQKGYDAQAKSDLRNLATIEETYMVDNNHYGTLAHVTVSPYNFKPSSNSGAASAIVRFRDAANAATAEATAVGGFVLCTTADSGTTWVYDSSAGGILSTHTCPAT